MRGIVRDEVYTAWIQSMRDASAKLDAHDWHASAVLGCLEAISSGITCMADVSATGASCQVMHKFGLRGIVYREVGAQDKRRVDHAGGNTIQERCASYPYRIRKAVGLDESGALSVRPRREQPRQSTQWRCLRNRRPREPRNLPEFYLRNTRSICRMQKRSMLRGPKPLVCDRPKGRLTSPRRWQRCSLNFSLDRKSVV